MTHFFGPCPKASACFVVSISILTACTQSPEGQSAGLAPQAVRAASTRVGPMMAGQEYLAEVFPERSVDIVARIPGTLAHLPVAQNESAAAGATLAKVLAPDIVARLWRVKAERRRAESARDFTCDHAGTDGALAESGDISGAQADVSMQNCAVARLALVAAQAVEREALVTTQKGVELAPFDGMILQVLADEGQTVMLGRPLLRYGSRAQRLRLRIPVSAMAAVEIGMRVQGDRILGHVVDVGGQATGPGRMMEVLAEFESASPIRVGSTVTVTLVTAHAEQASQVPLSAVGEDKTGTFVLLIRGEALERRDI